MSQIVLTPEEKAQIIEALNKNLEPSADLLPKLFPLVVEKQDKFDVQALDRAKIPTLEYAGKRKKAAILAEAIAGIGAAPLQTVRCFGETKDDEWKNLIVQGDNLQFLKTCYKDSDPLIKGMVKGKIKLIYIDPPFATKSDFNGKDGEYSYADKLDQAHFLETLRERLLYLKELLAKDGSIYIHLDQKMSHYVKVIMDEIFGKDNFINQITWKRTFAHGDSGQGAKHLGRISDVIFLYKKTEKFTLNTIYTPYDSEYIKKTFSYSDPDGRRWQSVSMTGPGGAANGNPYYEFLGVKRYWQYTRENMNKLYEAGKIYQSKPGTVPRKKMYLDESNGIPLQDIWTDIPPVQGSSAENSYYPTQKPEKLLERIIKTSSDEGDLVLDCFAGSGTTLASAEKLGRRWIGCDFGKHAIYTIQKRILRISENENYKKEPKPFCVVSSGAYDFTHVMDLRKNKDTYIDFVLGLFQLTRDSDKAAKFRLSNIYSVKDTNPVEVYPVWDDNYLKDVRIDEIYLQNILDQAGSRLHGDYYIITPESCANVGETTLKNQEGKDVIFHILTFPYKILEDISQKLVLEEQPSSAANINNLVTSTSFYFNEDVEIDVEKVEGGFKIKKFETKILDGNRNRFEGLSGLAMILVDLNYSQGKPFDMDVAVYAKEIGEDDVCKVDGLTPSVGIIAIDKHGNESKPFQIK